MEHLATVDEVGERVSLAVERRSREAERELETDGAGQTFTSWHVTRDDGCGLPDYDERYMIICFIFAVNCWRLSG